MLVNHGPSQQICKEEHKPWRGDATARYFTSHTKTVLPTRKSVPAIGPPEDLLTIVKRRKLQWYGHVSPAKTILQGTVKGGNKTRQTEEEVGRQHQGMDGSGVRQVPEGSGEQRKWKRIVVKSFVLPQTPLAAVEG